MKFTKENRESITSIGTVVLSLWILKMSLDIPVKNETFLQSAKVFPLIISSIMLVLSLLYMISSFRKSGWIRFSAIKEAAIGLVKSEETKRIALAILFVAIYVFLGVAKGRFYISSAIFMLFILLFYVRRIKPWISIVVSLAIVALCYVIFYSFFRVPLY